MFVHVFVCLSAPCMGKIMGLMSTASYLVREAILQTGGGFGGIHDVSSP